MSALANSQYKPTVCLVEDDDIMRQMFSRVISRAGATVLVTDGPEAAIKMLNTETVNIVISDYRMPSEEDGMRLLTYVKHRFPKIPVMMMSADLCENVESMLLASGADHCLMKPLKSIHMEMILSRCLT